MKRIRSMSGFIHPFHFNRNHLVGQMISHGIVEVEGEKYLLPDQTFFTKEPVHIFLVQNRFESETQYKERLEQERKEQELQELQQQQLKIEKKRIANELLIREQQALETFKERYDIPFAYSVRIKPVLSGLSENSNGDGAKRNTVFHLYVEEKISGRLKREVNTFLCTPNNDGKWTHIDEYTYDKPVTCKKCLQLMERWLIVNVKEEIR